MQTPQIETILAQFRVVRAGNRHTRQALNPVRVLQRRVTYALATVIAHFTLGVPNVGAFFAFPEIGWRPVEFHFFFSRSRIWSPVGTGGFIGTAAPSGIGIFTFTSRMIVDDGPAGSRKLTSPGCIPRTPPDVFVTDWHHSSVDLSSNGAPLSCQPSSSAACIFGSRAASGEPEFEWARMILWVILRT